MALVVDETIHKTTDTLLASEHSQAAAEKDRAAWEPNIFPQQGHLLATNGYTCQPHGSSHATPALPNGTTSQGCGQGHPRRYLGDHPLVTWKRFKGPFNRLNDQFTTLKRLNV